MPPFDFFFSVDENESNVAGPTKDENVEARTVPIVNHTTPKRLNTSAVSDLGMQGTGIFELEMGIE